MFDWSFQILLNTSTDNNLLTRWSILKITFLADELLYGDNEKMSLISEIMFRKFLRQFKTKTALPP